MQVFVQLVKMQQYELEMQRKKEEEERRRRREDMKRRKRMLEAAFEGDNNTIEEILKQVLPRLYLPNSTRYMED